MLGSYILELACNKMGYVPAGSVALQPVVMMLLSTGWVSVGKLQNLSEPQFPICKMIVIVTPIQ